MDDIQFTEASLDLIGLCKAVDDSLNPVDRTLYFDSTDEFIVIYFDKRMVKFGDTVSMYFFIYHECVYIMNLNIDREVEGKYIYSQMSIPYLLSLASEPRSQYYCTIGMVKNEDTIVGKIQFKIASKNFIYSNRKR
jgi:hypothetical protein